MKKKTTVKPQAKAKRRPFPASAATPGQFASRMGYAQVDEKVKGKPWMNDYYYLLDQGLEWRTALYIAWKSCPVSVREPKTQEQLAKDYLNLRSDRVIRKWRALNPKIDQYIAQMKAAPLMRYRGQVFLALAETASLITPDANSDRRLFFEMTGDYTPKSKVTLNVWQDELVKAVKEGRLKPEDVVRELGLEDARSILIAAGAAIPESVAEPEAGER